MPQLPFTISPNQSLTNTLASVSGTGFSAVQDGPPGYERQCRVVAGIGVSGLLEGDQLSVRIVDTVSGKTCYDLVTVARPYPTAANTGHSKVAAYVTGSPTAGASGITLNGVGAGAATHGLRFGDVSLHVPRYAHTAEMRVKFGSAPSAVEVLFGNWISGESGDTYVLYRGTDGKFSVTYNPQGFNGTTINTTTVTSTATVTDTTTEHHIALSYDPAGSGSIKVFLDGNRIISATGKFWDGALDQTRGMWIGRTGEPTNPSPLMGTISDFRWSGIVRYSGATYAVPADPIPSDSDTATLLPLTAVTPWADFDAVGAYVRVPDGASLAAYAYNQTAARGTLKTLTLESRLVAGSTLLEPINSGNPLFAREDWDDYADANPDGGDPDNGNGGRYTLQFSGLDSSNGDWGFGTATADSPEGPWTVNPGNPMGVPTDFGLNYIVSNGSILWYNGAYGQLYYHYYNDDNLLGIELMTSPTGAQGSWTHRGTVATDTVDGGRLLIDPWAKVSWRGVANELELVTSSQTSGFVVTDRDVRRYYSRDGVNWQYGGKVRDLSLGYEQYDTSACTGFGEPSARYDAGSGTYLMMNDSGQEAASPTDKRYINLVLSADPGRMTAMTIVPRAADFVSGNATQGYQVFDSSPFLSGGSLYLYHAGSPDGGLASEMHSQVHARKAAFVDPYGEVPGPPAPAADAQRRGSPTMVRSSVQRAVPDQKKTEQQIMRYLKKRR